MNAPIWIAILIGLALVILGILIGVAIENL